MPRIKQRLEDPPKPRFPALLAELMQELKSNHEAGQPIIVEQHFPRTNLISVTVIWDKWVPLSDEDRAATVRYAYEEVEGKEFRDRIALSIGLTVPEAYESGMLPYQVTAALRKGDPVTAEQCAQAMLEEGASLLFDPDHPQLRFATEQEAEASVKRLSRALPGSEPVWLITKEMDHPKPSGSRDL